MSMQRQRRRFSIPKKIAANFRIKGDLSRAEEWRAKVLQCNSGNVKKGCFDHVGYIMISTDSETSFPLPVATNIVADMKCCGMFIIERSSFRKNITLPFLLLVRIMSGRNPQRKLRKHFDDFGNMAAGTELCKG